MKRFAPWAIAASITLAAAPVTADPNDAWRDGYGHMMWGGGFGIFGGLMMLVFWAAVIAAIVFAVRWLSDRDGKQNNPDALDILKERLAKGEIDPDDYEARRKILEG